MILRQFDARHFRQDSFGFGEIAALHLHDEGENIPADVADPAFERLPFRVDLQARLAVVVPRTARYEKTPLTLQGKIFADQVDNINLFANLFFYVV